MDKGKATLKGTSRLSRECHCTYYTLLWAEFQLCQLGDLFPLDNNSLDAIRLAKAAVDASALSLYDGLREEAYFFDQARLSPEGVERMRRFLAQGGQTRPGEMDLNRYFTNMENGK